LNNSLIIILRYERDIYLYLFFSKEVFDSLITVNTFDYER